MKYQALVLLAAVASAIAQGVTAQVKPEGGPPDGCQPHVDGSFEITVVEIGNMEKRDLVLQVIRLRPASLRPVPPCRPLTQTTEARRLLRRWHPRGHAVGQRHS